MWFSLFVAVLILAVTFYQGLLGMFSALINCILTILAAALAYGLHEDVYYAYLLPNGWGEDGRGIALAGLFIVSLLIMRVIVDLLIKDNMHFPVYVDRAGGGVFGLITALIIIGVLAHSIQMLPFNYQWLGFSRYTLQDSSGKEVDLTPPDTRGNTKTSQQDVLAGLDLSTVQFKRQKLWFNPDAFAVSVASYLSDNALAGSNSLSEAHPAMLDEEFWSHFTSMGEATTVAKKADAVSVIACWKLPSDKPLPLMKKVSGKYALQPATGKDSIEPGNRLVAVRLKLGADLNDGSNGLRFTTNQIRLVTKPEGGRTASYGFVGLDAEIKDGGGKTVLFRIAEGETVAGAATERTFVFEIPTEARPWYVVARHNARAEITQELAAAPKNFSASPAVANKDSGKPTHNKKDTNGSETGGSHKVDINMHKAGDSADEARGGGRTRRYSSDEEGSSFDNRLPGPFTNYDTEECEVHSGKVIGGAGRLTAKLNQDDTLIKGDKPALTTFDVPEGKRLLQLSIRRTHPGSLYGQVMDFARQLANVSVQDDKGKEYRAIGTWGIATVGRNRIFELVYYDEMAQAGRSNPPKLDIIRSSSMSTNYALYYLFQVPPGTKIVRFMTPNSNGEDLTPQKLVAPK